MMMPLLSSAAGHLHFQLPESSVLNPGDLIAKLDLDDPEAVTRAELFEGTFPEMGPPQVYSLGVDHRFKQSLHDARMILAGAHPVAPSAVQHTFSSHLQVSICTLRRCKW